MRRFVLLLLALALTNPAAAAVTLRWSPGNAAVDIGEIGTISVMLDDAVDLRTIELRVSYAPDLLFSLEGEEGSAFTELDCMLFPDFADATPGEWYGGVAVIGFDCWVTGPGELFRWTFQGIGEGNCPIETLQVRLYDPAAHLIADVSLPGTSVAVEDLTAVQPLDFGHLKALY